MSKETTQKPLVYSCSGCSSAAQMANYIALRLDREGVAEMSCIAGVGGDVRKLVKVATSGRPVIGIDGCPLACVKHSLARHGVEPLSWHELSGYEVEKIYGQDFDQAQADKVKAEIIASLPEQLKPE
jgi:uncharacterized metal-binding protein